MPSQPFGVITPDALDIQRYISPQRSAARIVAGFNQLVAAVGGIAAAVESSAAGAASEAEAAEAAEGTGAAGQQAQVKGRFGTSDPDALAECDTAGKISYNRANIRKQAMVTGRTPKHELYITAYHELGHRILNGLNNLVQRLFGLSMQPYFLSPTWAAAEETIVELFGQVAAYWRKNAGKPW